MCQHLDAGMGPDCSHRGPDGSAAAVAGPYRFRFHQLNVVLPQQPGHGATQPLTQGRKTLVCNGEIYNAEVSEGASDCMALFDVVGEQAPIQRAGPYRILQRIAACSQLRGEYAFVMVDEESQTLWAGRDQFGVRPMYQAHCSVCDRLCFASEAVCFKGPFRCGVARALDVRQFKPNTLLELPYATDPVGPKSAEQRLHRGSREPREQTIHWWNPAPPTKNAWVTFLDAVRVRVGGNLEGGTTQVGILLSGGIDSGALLVACSQLGFGPRCIAFTQQLRSALEADTEDVRLATALAKELGIAHRVYKDTPLAALKAVPEVVDAIASYDTTTVRASTPAFLLCRHIRQDYPAIRVLLCGEGADELFGGYQYFRHAPDVHHAAAESERLLGDLHGTDIRRVCGTAGASGFEVRPAYLDRDFVHCVTSVPDEERFGGLAEVEKKWWRDICATQAPAGSTFEKVVKRAKEAFSDGVGHGWVDLLRNGTATGEETPGGDAWLARASRNYRHVPPRTKEALWYRKLFEDHYGPERETLVSHMWMPAPWASVGDPHDPSARALVGYRST